MIYLVDSVIHPLNNREVLRGRYLKTAVSLQKRIKCFPTVHTAPWKFENETVIGHVGFVIEEYLGRAGILCDYRNRFRKAPFSSPISVNGI